MLPQLRSLFGAAYRMTGNAHDAEDLVQETFLRAHRAFDRFEPGSNARAWLHTILQRVRTDAFRRTKRRPETVELAGRGPGDAAAPGRARFGPRGPGARASGAARRLPRGRGPAGRAGAELRRDRGDARDPGRHRDVAYPPGARAAPRGARREDELICDPERVTGFVDGELDAESSGGGRRAPRGLPGLPGAGRGGARAARAAAGPAGARPARRPRGTRARAGARRRPAAVRAAARFALPLAALPRAGGLAAGLRPLRRLGPFARPRQVLLAPPAPREGLERRAAGRRPTGSRGRAPACPAFPAASASSASSAHATVPSRRCPSLPTSTTRRRRATPRSSWCRTG